MTEPRSPEDVLRRVIAAEDAGRPLTFRQLLDFEASLVRPLIEDGIVTRMQRRTGAFALAGPGARAALDQVDKCAPSAAPPTPKDTNMTVPPPVYAPSDDDRFGPPPEFRWINRRRLTVDPRYQREVTKVGRTKIKCIVRTFAWAKFQPLTVAGPGDNGHYAVVDGQHRLAVAEALEFVLVPCWIVGTGDLAAEASTFIGINKDRIGVTRVNQFWAELARGDDQARAVKDVCDAAAVTISRSGTGRQKPGETAAVCAIEAGLKRGREVVETALKAIAVGQTGKANALRPAMISATVNLVGDNPEHIDPGRLVVALTGIDVDRVIGEALAIKRTLGGKTEDHLRAILAKAYNHGLSKNRLEG